MKNLLLLSVLFVFIMSCKNETKTDGYTIETKIYAVDGSGSEFEKDSLQFVEKEYFNKKGNLLKKEFFTDKMVLKGTENYLYKDGSGKYHRSNYMAPDSSLLSYYKHTYDAKQNLVSSSAFNGATDEFLRIERLYYNDKNLRTDREIRSIDNEIQRKFSFTLDGFGNETSMTVLQADGQTIFKEIYKITDYNDDNEWLEKWGFVNDVPNSYRERSFIK